MKKLLAVLMVCSLCAGCGLATSNQQFTAYAPMKGSASKSIIGSWAMDGKVTLTANLTDIVSMTVTLPNVSILNDVFTFDDANNFSDTVIGMSGTYTTPSKAGAFTINLHDWINALQTELQNVINEYGYPVVLTVTNQSFTGSVTSATKSTGKFSVTIKLTAEGINVGQVTLSGNLTGTAVVTSSADLVNSGQTPQSIANLIAQKVILPALGHPAN